MPPSCLSRACVLRLAAPPCHSSTVAPVPPPRSAVYLRLFFVAPGGHDGLGARFQLSILQSRDSSLRPTAFGRQENDKAKGRPRGKSRIVPSETAANPLSARHSGSSGKIHEASAAFGHMAPRAGALVDAHCEPSSASSAKQPPADLEVAVIGAGAAGLVAARELRREGHRVTVFEQGERGVGGVWRYDSSTEDDPLGTKEGRREVHGSMYASLRTNLPREVMGFTDFPFSYPLPGDDRTHAPGAAAATTGAAAAAAAAGAVAAAGAAAATGAAAGAAGAAAVYSDEMLADSRRFPSHTEVLRYLERFSQHFGLVDCIRFGAKVVDVRAVGKSEAAAVTVAAAAAASQDEENTGTSSSTVRKCTRVDTDAATAAPTGACTVASGMHEAEGGRETHLDSASGLLLATVQDQHKGSGVQVAEGTQRQGKQEARDEAVRGGGDAASVGHWRPCMRVSWVQRRRDSSSWGRSSSASDGSAKSQPSSQAPPPLAPADAETAADEHVALSRSEGGGAVSAAPKLPPANEGSEETDDENDMLTESQVFDAVVVCNGHYSRPRIAHIPGLEEWPGFQLHSHNYREPSSFAGKVVAVVGAGASGDDLSREIASVAKAVHMSSRGWNDEASVPTRDDSAWPNLWYHPMVVRAHADGTLEYADGERVHTDVLMHCTGYHYHFPFLRSLADVVRVEGNRVGPLYRHVFPPQLTPSLSFIGLPWKVVPFPLCEMQAKWVAKALTAMHGCSSIHRNQPEARGSSRQSGEVEEAAAAEFLPSVVEMEAEAQKLYDKLKEAGVPVEYTHRFDLKGVPGTDQFEYVDWLARQCGYPPLPTWRRAMYVASSQRKRRCPETYRDKWEDEVEVQAAASEFASAVAAVGASANFDAVQIGLS